MMSPLSYVHRSRRSIGGGVSMSLSANALRSKFARAVLVAAAATLLTAHAYAVPDFFVSTAALTTANATGASPTQQTNNSLDLTFVEALTSTHTAAASRSGTIYSDID